MSRASLMRQYLSELVAAQEIVFEKTKAIRDLFPDAASSDSISDVTRLPEVPGIIAPEVSIEPPKEKNFIGDLSDSQLEDASAVATASGKKVPPPKRSNDMQWLTGNVTLAEGRKVKFLMQGCQETVEYDIPNHYSGRAIEDNECAKIKVSGSLFLDWEEAKK